MKYRSLFKLLLDRDNISIRIINRSKEIAEDLGIVDSPSIDTECWNPHHQKRFNWTIAPFVAQFTVKDMSGTLLAIVCLHLAHGYSDKVSPLDWNHAIHLFNNNIWLQKLALSTHT